MTDLPELPLALQQLIVQTAAELGLGPSETYTVKLALTRAYTLGMKQADRIVQDAFEIDLMTRALTKPVTMSFNTNAEATNFRYACYTYRRSLRGAGINKYDRLTFKLIRNTLTIRVKEHNYEVL